MDIVKKIERLKEEKNAVILAHNYQRPEIQDIADFIGDSLGLSIEASKTKANVIVFCGVDFMQETGKIINPEKKVLIPENAICPMAMMLSPEEIKKVKEKYNAPVVLYVNTSAECKALADYSCTSANAIKIVNSIESETVIFGPDKNLADYVRINTEKKIIPVPEYGICSVHHQISQSDVKKAKNLHKNAKLVVHPETKIEVSGIADYVGSTEQMIKYCKNSNDGEFIIGTENGIIYRMKKEMPEKDFYPASETAICTSMKMTTLKSVYNSLKYEQFDITLDDEIIKRAKKGIDRMLELI